MGGRGASIVGIGPFRVALSVQPAGAAAMADRLYRHHPRYENDAFADFHVSVTRAAGPRRFWKPQALFRFDNQVPFKPLPLPQALPFLEWGLNWVIANHAHQYLILHAAVLARGGDALVLPGPPGSGKSTVAAMLMTRGWRLLSDELALFDPQTSLLVGLARPVSLKEDSIALLRDHAPDACFSEEITDTAKGALVLMGADAQSVREMLQPAAARWLAMPQYAPGAPTRLVREPKARMFMWLADNAFNYNILGRTGFDCLAAVVEAAHCFRLPYASAWQAADALEELASCRS